MTITLYQGFGFHIHACYLEITRCTFIVSYREAECFHLISGELFPPYSLYMYFIDKQLDTVQRYYQNLLGIDAQVLVYREEFLLHTL